MSRYRIRAFKPTEGQRLIACEETDTEANTFYISYFVHGSGFSAEVEVDTLYLAREIVGAMDSAFTSGQRDAFKQLRELIGAK